MNGGLLVISAASVSATGAGLGLAYVLVGLLLMIAGGGIVAEQTWAWYLGTIVLVFDVVVRATRIFGGDLVSAVWLVASVGALLVLVFGRSYTSAPRADMDEDASTIRYSNIRR